MLQNKKKTKLTNKENQFKSFKLTFFFLIKCMIIISDCKVNKALKYSFSP